MLPLRRPPAVPDEAAVARLATVRGVAPVEAGHETEPAGDAATLREALVARLPETVRGARLHPGAHGAMALALVAAVAIAATGVVVWRARPRAVEITPPRVVTAATPSAALLVVDVAGAVRRPGLVRLPAGSRVADALAAAGGLRPGASTAGLNLARRVVDGEQVLVGAASAPGVGTPASPEPGALLDLNVATLEQLDALPGVGPVLAQRIVEWRAAHGRFATVDQLREVSGIGPRKFESLRGLVTV